MLINELNKKLVAVLGYGQEGKAVTKYLISHGITPVLFDNTPWQEWPAQEQQGIKNLNINFIFGPDCVKELAGFDVVFRSPGVKLSDLAEIKKINPKLSITSQTKWFFKHCPAKIIGVTGTKGKGTTATLIHEILKLQSQNLNSEFQTYLTGNIGKTQPLEILDNLKPDDWVVYELSSFQLQDLEQSPHIGVVLMVTSEHLDYHRDIHEYVDAKSSVCKFQSADDFCIFNANYESSADIGHLGRGHKLDFNTFKLAASPEKSGDCFVKDGQIYLKNQQFLNTNQLQLRGSHNWQNVCAAILATDAAGCDSEIIKKTVQNFKGLEHRLEFVAEKNGIKFYNDSFSTTPETAIAAIKAFNEPEILILGGSSKKSDFTELGKMINESKNIKTIILIGNEAAKIKSAIGANKHQILEGAKNMKEIFGQIKQTAEPGDVVILSPACASFDMFSNYADRGNQFKSFVQNYAR